MPPPFFTIVIPTRNEAEDILPTLESIRSSSFQAYEVLVVDASTDDTVQIVESLSDPRIRVLGQDNCDGRCGARNQGILAGRGEVTLILNADVRLPPDFLTRLKAHYDDGADYVIVDAIVGNRAHPFGAMVEAEHHYLYSEGRETVNWCEGYSCRRVRAIEAGLFPTGSPVPICAGEDAVFGQNMAGRFRRVVDGSLLVTHVVPESLRAFWTQREGRGQGCPQRLVFLEHWSLSRTALDGAWWTFKSVLWVLLLFPMIRYACILGRYVPEVGASGLLLPLLISRVAHEIGRWKGFWQVSRARRPGSQTTKV